MQHPRKLSPNSARSSRLTCSRAAQSNTPIIITPPGKDDQRQCRDVCRRRQARTGNTPTGIHAADSAASCGIARGVPRATGIHAGRRQRSFPEYRKSCVLPPAARRGVPRPPPPAPRPLGTQRVPPCPPAVAVLRNRGRTAAAPPQDRRLRAGKQRIVLRFRGHRARGRELRSRQKFGNANKKARVLPVPRIRNF